jgi:succinyl-CoA:mesaconate CoA transferase
MYDAMVSLAERTVYQYSCDGEPPTRQGNSHPTLFPYDAFEADDGHVVIAAFSDGHWRTLCETMGRPDLAADYPDAGSRLKNRDALRAEIAEWTRQHAVDDIVERLDRRVPAARVQDTSDVFEDPHVHDREMLAEVSQPGVDETMTVAGSPIKMTETMPEPRGRAPLLNEHDEELLDEAAQSSDRQPAETDD